MEIALAAESLTVTRSGQTVLKDVSFSVSSGDIYALLGGNGAGKSTTLLTFLGFLSPDSGTARVLGNKVAANLKASRQSTAYLPEAATLYPHRNAYENLGYFLSLAKGKARDADLDAALDRVSLQPDARRNRLSTYSKGMRQKVAIALALLRDTPILLLDEPTSALDMTVQVQIVDLLRDLQHKYQLAYLFISHDLSIVRYLSDRVMVMYLGHVVESGTTEQVFAPPYHPYTEALLSAVPIADTSVEKQHIVLEGDIPSAMNPPAGCPFQTRCRWKSEVPGGLCEKEVPPVRHLAEGHQVKCHLADDILARMEPVIKIAAE